MNDILANLDRIRITEILDFYEYSEIVRWLIDLNGEIVIKSRKFETVDDVDEHYPIIYLNLNREKKNKWEIEFFGFGNYITQIEVNETKQFEGEKFSDNEVIKLMEDLKYVNECPINVRTIDGKFEALFGVLMRAIDKQKKVDVITDFVVNLI